MKNILFLALVAIFGLCSCENAQEKNEIEAYHQYRIRETAKYHNYDTSYVSARNDYYEGKKPCPEWYDACGKRRYAGWEEHDSNNTLYVIIPSIFIIGICAAYYLRNKV